MYGQKQENKKIPENVQWGLLNKSIDKFSMLHRQDILQFDPEENRI